MPRKSANRDKPKSGAGGDAWYTTPQGRRQTAREFARALKKGELSRSPGLNISKTDPKLLDQLVRQAKENASQPISIRVSIADLERAKQIAKKTGSGYQTVLKQAIRIGLSPSSSRKRQKTG